MQISTAYSSTSLALTSQTFQSAFTAPAVPPQPLASGDHVDVSEKAVESSRRMGRHAGSGTDMTLQLLRDVISFLSEREVQELEATPGDVMPENRPPLLADSANYQEASLSAEHASLSLSGTISTKDGKELGFSLDLQYDHASLSAQSAQLQAGPEGLSFRYDGIAAELTSTNFSFTLSTDGGSAPNGGKGSFNLNTDISRIGKELKPLVKEFMGAAGINGGWGSMNRFLRSVA